MVAPRAELTQAVGALLRADAARVAALAERLRAPDRVIESTVEGRSMGPGLPSGSRIRIELAPRSRYEPGEVIAFLAGGQVVVHRVVHGGAAAGPRSRLLTRGDVVIVPDPPLERTCVLGPVVGVRRTQDWSPAAGPPPRRLAVRAAARAVLWAAVALLHLDRRASTLLLGLLHRGEGALRAARVRARTPP